MDRDRARKRCEPSQIALGRGANNHVRAVNTTLALLDEQLCAFLRWAQGRQATGVLFRERNNLSAAARGHIRHEVEAMRHILREMRQSLGLSPSVQDAADAIWSWCWTLLEPLQELTGKRLRRYGDPPPGLAGYLEPRVMALCDHLERILNITSEARGREEEPPAG